MGPMIPKEMKYNMFIAWLWQNTRHEFECGNRHTAGIDKDMMPPTESPKCYHLFNALIFLRKQSYSEQSSSVIKRETQSRLQIKRINLKKYADVEGVLLPRNGKVTMGTSKSSLLS